MKACINCSAKLLPVTPDSSKFICYNKEVCEKCYNEIMKYVNYAKHVKQWYENGVWRKFIEKKFHSIFKRDTQYKKLINKIKNNLPRFYFYKYNTGISILPHLGIQWHKYQGSTSKGCLKFQINFGWIIFGAGIIWNHK